MIFLFHFDQVKQLYNGIDITTNLVGHWKLTDRKGTTAKDSSGYKHNGTIVGATFADRDIRCWNSGWDENNFDVILETFIDPCDRNYLFNNVKPGVLSDKTMALGWRIVTDITYKSGNSLVYEPIGGYGVSSLRERRVIAIKNISDRFINQDVLGVKIEASRIRKFSDYT